MQKDKLVKLLEKFNSEEVGVFASYIMRLYLEKDRKTGKLKNYWIQNRKEEEMADLFKRVSKDGLVFDGVHITLQSTGISYDYVAYKNKMFLAYPETTIDVNLVYEGDKFNAKNESGKIIYNHTIANPFNQTEQTIIGAYSVIKNKRGDFLTLLSKKDIDKHRKVAKTDYIWKSWFNEMALKTVIKKACKQHFADIFQNIEKNDNENYELENPIELDLKYKQAIDKIEDVEKLKEYYIKNKGKGKEFDKYIIIRKKQLTK